MYTVKVFHLFSIVNCFYIVFRFWHRRRGQWKCMPRDKLLIISLKISLIFDTCMLLKSTKQQDCVYKIVSVTWIARFKSSWVIRPSNRVLAKRVGLFLVSSFNLNPKSNWGPYNVHIRRANIQHCSTIKTLPGNFRNCFWILWNSITVFISFC